MAATEPVESSAALKYHTVQCRRERSVISTTSVVKPRGCCEPESRASVHP